MASSYTWPGVYVEEVSSAFKPITGVGTSIAAFIGVSEDIASGMPEKADGTAYAQAAATTPVAVNSWTEFTQNFGGFQTANQYLAHAVFGFFNNGGNRCWVIRIAAGDTLDAALQTLESIDEVTIVAAPLPPDTSATALNAAHVAMVGHCENMKNRVAIMDSARDITTLGIGTDATHIWRPADSQDGYGAFYFPWIQVADPLGAAGTQVAVPPSGHLAGIYARSDAERGVHKAPANEIIRGALDLKYPVSRNLQGSLNVSGVNCIRSFHGTIKVYGARTISPPADAEWRYISVRRLVNYLRSSIDAGTQWAVFEPNAPDLWSKIRRNVSAFLNTEWAAGALVGATPEQAFYVRCDETTNPPDLRAQGQLVTEIGVAVVSPAEFVIFRLSQWAGPGQ